MKPSIIIITLLAALCMTTGCAYHAKHYKAPDRTAVITASTALRHQIATAKATAQEAREKTTAIGGAVQAQGVLIATDSNKLQTLLQAVPSEFRDQITALADDNARLAEANTDLAGKVADVEAVQSRHALEMEQEIPTAEALLAKADDTYMATADDQAAKLNAAELAHAADSAEIVRLRTQSILFKIAAGLGLLAIIILGFLWFTGRLASAGAAIAAKFP